MKKYFVAVAVIIAFFLCASAGYAQHWSLGGNMGLSMLGGSPGFHLTPSAELLVGRNIGIGSELSINTQYGAPFLWHPYFKYYFDVRGSHWKPFANAGPLLAFNVPNGPCFGVLFGGGVNIPIANRLYIAPNVLLGPIFNYGGGVYPFILQGYYWGIHTYGLSAFTYPSTTIFAFSVRAGIRYEI
jgi:hypothetical protein